MCVCAVWRGKWGNSPFFETMNNKDFDIFKFSNSGRLKLGANLKKSAAAAAKSPSSRPESGHNSRGGRISTTRADSSADSDEDTSDEDGRRRRRFRHREQGIPGMGEGEVSPNTV